VGPRLREAGEVSSLHLLDLKTCLRDESRNVPRYGTALEHPVKNRFPPLLPPPHARIRGKPVLEKDEPAAWPQDTSDASYGLHHARDRAEREGANNRIDRTVLQGDALPRQVQELDVQLRQAPMLFCEPDHARVGLERVELADFFGVVVNEVDAGPYADFQDGPSSRGDDPLPNFPEGFRVA